MRLGAAREHLHAQPRRPRRAALLAVERGAQEPSRRRPAVVHDHVRARQHLHQPAGASVRARAGRDHAPRARLAPGHSHRRFPRRGSRPDPPRDALRRADRLRGAAPLPVLRLGRRNSAVRRPAGRVRALDRRPKARSRLEHEALAALEWIDEYADLQGNGYISYQRRNEETGLENQCWKDSWDSISYRDGRLPGFPRATCELQGYAYDAKMRGARLAREIWKDPVLADQLEKEAADLKRRFNRDFWIADRGYFALALAPTARRSTRSRPTTAICSGAGSWTSPRRSPWSST